MSAFSSPTSSTPLRGGALDALRFVAALFVVVFHFGDQAPVALSELHPFLGRGYLATDFFLMLSGFVLAKAYGPAVAAHRISLGRFWSKRFVRCYPTHLITLALLAAMVGAGALSGFLAKGLGYPAYYVALAIVSALGLLLCRPLLRRFAPSPSSP